MSHRTKVIERRLRSPPSSSSFQRYVTNTNTGGPHDCSTVGSSSSAQTAASVEPIDALLSSENAYPRRHCQRRWYPSSSYHMAGDPSSSAFLQKHLPSPLHRHRHNLQQRCYASASNDFWRDLNEAVQDGDAIQAEEMVKVLLIAAESDGREVTDQDHQQSEKGRKNGKSYAATQTKRPPIDTKLFSMVLQAWKNHRHSATTSTNKFNTSLLTISNQTGLRATQLIDQMVLLAKSGALTTPPSLEDYHAVLECWIQQTSSPPSATIATATPLMNGDQIDSATQHIQRLLSLIAEPSTDTMELALVALANEGKSNEILQIIMDVRTKALSKGSGMVQPTLNMYNSLIRAYVMEGIPDRAIMLLEKMQDQTGMNGDKSSKLPLPNPNRETYNLLIAHFCDRCHLERLEKAEDLVDQMRSHKVQRTAASYLPVITGLSKLAEAKRAENLLARMVQDYQTQFDAELKLTLAPFRSVLWGYTKSYHPEAADDAESLLNNIIELNQNNILEERPSTWSFNLVLKCWARSKDLTAPRRAKQLYDRMSSHGIVPDSTSMNTVLNTWAKKANPVNTEKLFWEFYDSYIQDPLQYPQPNIISFGTVLNALASKASRYTEAPDRAEALFRKLFELHEAGWDDCRPDSAAFSSLMQCWGKSKRPGGAEKAESILRKMQDLAEEGGDPDMAPDTICWNSAIQAWALAGDGERAEALFREMLANYIRDKDERHRPNIITFTAVLSAWAKTRFNRQAPKRAVSLLEQMEKLHDSGALHVKPNYVSYSIVLDCLAYAKKKWATERAEMMLDHMKQSTDRDLKPNVVSYNAVIKAWSFMKDPRAVTKVIALLDELVEKSQDSPRMTPNANTFGSVLKTIADSRHTDKASRADAIVSLMEKYDIHLDDWSRNQLERCHESTFREETFKSENIAMPEIPNLDYSA